VTPGRCRHLVRTVSSGRPRPTCSSSRCAGIPRSLLQSWHSWRRPSSLVAGQDSLSFAPGRELARLADVHASCHGRGHLRKGPWLTTSEPGFFACRRWSACPSGGPGLLGAGQGVLRAGGVCARPEWRRDGKLCRRPRPAAGCPRRPADGPPLSQEVPPPMQVARPSPAASARSWARSGRILGMRMEIEAIQGFGDHPFQGPNRTPHPTQDCGLS
jgi:hypothetical protein